jgi:hypothetical protein
LREFPTSSPRSIRARPGSVQDFGHVLLASLLAERTYWEKVTLIHAKNTRRNPKANVEPYSRYWYDLAMPSLSRISVRVLTCTDLRDHVIATKTAPLGVAGVNYAEVGAGACKLVPRGALNDGLEPWTRTMDSNHGLERDYASMPETGMFNLTPPAWAELMVALDALRHRSTVCKA